MLDKSKCILYNYRVLFRTIARYGAVRYYREESPGFTGEG